MTWIDRDRILDLIGWEFYQFHMIFLIVGVISELNNLMTWIDSDRILDLVGWEFSCRGWEFSYRCCIDNEIPVHENLSTHNKIFYFCRFCLLVYFSCYPLSISPTGKLISYLSIFGVWHQQEISVSGSGSKARARSDWGGRHMHGATWCFGGWMHMSWVYVCCVCTTMKLSWWDPESVPGLTFRGPGAKLKRSWYKT
jgi:hypothetical protein